LLSSCASSNLNLAEPGFGAEMPNVDRLGVVGLPVRRRESCSPGRLVFVNVRECDCPGGGIGRHARLRIWCRKTCRFKSCPGHHYRILDKLTEAALTFIFGLGQSWKIQITLLTPVVFVNAFKATFKPSLTQTRGEVKCP
jgi:hypothetical protein